MKPKFRHLRHLALIGSFVVSGTAAVAATGTWNYGSTTAANLSWGYSNATTPSWTSNIIPNAVGDIADFSVLNITAAKAITLDADRTIGTLKIGDSGSSYFAYTFNSGTPTTSRLIFDQTGVANASMVLATAATAASTAANVINTGILLKDNLVIDSYQTSASTIALAMNGVIDDGSGSFSITKNGPSIISMSAANTYDGGTTITGGRITAANASSFGTGQVTVNGSGQAYLSSSLTYANNFSIAGNGFTETAGNLGAIRYSGATTSGSLNVAADARIVAYTAATGTLNGALTGTAALEINGSTASFNGTFNLNGSAAGYSGALTVSQGRLNLATTTNPGGSLSVKDGAILSGETSVNGALTLGNSGSTTTGPTLYIDASTADTLHTNGNLILNGKTTVALTGAVSGSSVPVLSYSGALTGNATNLDLMGGLAGYRPGTGFDFSVANQINLTLITGNVTWTGAATSAWNTTDVNWFDGTSSTTFYNLDSITFDESHSGKATYTTNLTNAANNDLVFTAVASGAAGEAVMIQYLDPFTPSSPLSVSVAGSVINVSLATDALGLITSTASTVQAAITASAPASALTSVALAAGNDGSGLVTAQVSSFLAMTNPAITIASGLTVSPGNMTFNHSAIDYSVGGTGVIGGGGSLTKTGSGSLTLTTANTFAGGSTLSGGRLRIGSSTALGGGAVALNGGQLSSDGTTARILTNAYVLSGSFLLGDATDNGALSLLGGGSLAGNTIIEVPSANTISQTLGGTLTDGASSFSLTKRGSNGILALSGANTYDGGTFIEAGSISASTATSFGTGTVTVSNGAQANLAVAGTFANAFSLSGVGFNETTGQNGAIRLQGSTVNGPISLTGDSRITAYGSTGTLAGTISETGGSWALELSNYSTATDSTLTVAGNNSFSAGTTVKGAVVIANNSHALGSGPVSILSNGTAARTTRLELGTNVVINNDITINSTALTNFRGAIHSYAGSLTTPSLAIVNGTVTIQSSVGNGGHLAAEASSLSVLRVMGPIHVTAGLVPLIRVGTVELGGGGDYLQLNHAEGLLKLAASSGINPAASLILASSATSTFDLNGKTQTLTGLTKGTTDVAKIASVTNNHATDASTLTLNLAADSTYAGTFVTGTSALSLVKTGAATLTLAGVSSAFGGSLAVTNGGLNLTGTLGSAAATTTMGPATTLSGEGIFGGNLTLSGTLLNANGNTAPGVYVTGTLNVSSGVTVNLLSLPPTPGPIKIIEFGTALTGSAANFTLVGSANFRSPVFSVGTNAVTLTLGTPVDLTWTGSGGSTWNAGTTSNWNNVALTPSTFYYADNVTFGNTGGGSISVPANVNAGNMLINSNDNWSFQGAGTVLAAAVTKDGSGSATFATPVNFSGAITLTAGTLRLSPPTGVAETLPGAISGAGSLAKGGDGSLSLPIANAGFTGSTVIAKGELIVGNSTALGSGSLTFGDSSTLATDTAKLTLGSGVTVTGKSITVGPECLDATIASLGGTLAAPTILKRGSGVLRIGDATSQLATTNYVTGTTAITVEGGALDFSSINAAAATTTITLGNASSGATDTILDVPVAASADQVVLSTPVTLGTLAGGATSKAILRYPGSSASLGSSNFAGTVALNGRDLYISNTSDTTPGGIIRLWAAAGAISGTGNVHVRDGVTITGDYNALVRTRLSGANTWVGDLYLETGMLQLGNGSAGSALNTIPNASVVYVSAGTRLGVGGGSETFAGIVGGAAAGTAAAALLNPNTGGSGTTTVTLAGSGTYVYDGTMSDESTHIFALVKSTAGTQTVNGACSYSGATSITGGKLVINNTCTSAITVASGGTLGGNLTSSAAITATSAVLASAKIAPGPVTGTTTGTLTAASATMNTGTLLDFEINDASTPKNDKLAITGTLTLGSAALNLTVTGTPTQPVYVLASYGTLSGTFGTITGKPGNYDLVYNYNDGASSNNIALVQQADPYLTWLAASPALSGANRAPNADFDNDGLANAVEFVIGADPTLFTDPATAGYPKATVTGGNLVFTFKRSDASHAYPVAVETSSDLATWSTSYSIPNVATAGLPVTVVDNGSAPDDVTVTIPMAPNARIFARLRVDVPFTP